MFHQSSRFYTEVMSTHDTHHETFVFDRCAIVHSNLPNQWHHIAKSWFENAYGEYAVKQNCVEIWKTLIAEVVPKTLQFLSRHKSSVLRHGTLHDEQVSSVLVLLLFVIFLIFCSLRTKLLPSFFFSTDYFYIIDWKFAIRGDLCFPVA